jgi:hypothetical protein
VVDEHPEVIQGRVSPALKTSGKMVEVAFVSVPNTIRGQNVGTCTQDECREDVQSTVDWVLGAVVMSYWIVVSP